MFIKVGRIQSRQKILFMPSEGQDSVLYVSDILAHFTQMLYRGELHTSDQAKQNQPGKGRRDDQVVLRLYR